MKTCNFLKALIILFILIGSQQMWAQNIFPEPGPGNVGIGTITPNFHLDIKATNATIALGIGQSGPHKIKFGDDAKYQGMNISYNTYWNDLRIENFDKEMLFSVDADNGDGFFRDRVGIGTHHPKANLDVYGTKDPQIRLSTPSSYFQIGVATSNKHFSNQAEIGDAVLRVLGKGQKLIFDTGSSAKGGESFVFVGAGDAIMTITDDKTVDVCGDFRAKEVRVETGWCDYVFDKAYHLPTLKEEAQFIKKNGHLLDFESAKDMDGKINVGDVTKRQQETIEKLMLHLIKMDEKMSKMTNELKTLKAQVEEGK